MPHIGDVRAAKSAFQLSTVLSFVKQATASTVAKGQDDDMSAWDSVGNYFAQVIQEAARIVPMSLETENTLKSRFSWCSTGLVYALTACDLRSTRDRSLGAPD